MERFISSQAVNERLQIIRDSYVSENKRTAAIAAQDCLDAIAKIETKNITFEPETALRLVCLEPFFKDGAIGRDVYRCEKCGNRVGKYSRFCESCGRRLVDRK